MSRPVSTTAIFSAALLLLSALGGCTGRGPDGAPPPPVASPPPPADAPVLMGGPRDQPPTPDAPAPVERSFTAMAPVANPEDMSPEERARVYGSRYDHSIHHRYWRMQAGQTVREDAGQPLTPRRHHHGRHHQAPHGSAYRVWHPNHALNPNESHAAAPSQPASAPAPAPSPAQPAPAISPPNSTNSSNLDWLSIPGAPTVNLPGLGWVPSKYLTGALLLVLAIALLVFAARRGQTAAPPRRPARETVGAGPDFADERPARSPAGADEPVAPFPHNEDEHLGA